MDVAGLLGAVLALAIYPGGVTLVLLAAVAHRGGGRPGPDASGWSRAAILAAIAAGLVAALLPLPGSPARSLPPDSGPGANLVAVALLLAVGAGALPGGIWTGRGLAAAGLVAVALVAMAAPAGSFSTEVVATFPGTAYGIARAGAAGALGGVGLLLSRGRRRPQEEGGRVALVVACNLVAVYLVAADLLGRVPGPVGAAVVVAGATVGAAADLRLGRRLPGAASETLTALCAAVALFATLIAAR